MGNTPGPTGPPSVSPSFRGGDCWAPARPAGLALVGRGQRPAARRATATPRRKPIPGGLDEAFKAVPSDPFIHVLPPAVGFDMSTITDFAGVVAAAEI